MKRTVIEIRELGGRIQVRHPIDRSWHDSTLSPSMRLDDLSVPDVKSLLDSYLDEDYLKNGVWDMRIAAQKKIGEALWQSTFGTMAFEIGPWLHIVPVVDASTSAGFADFVCKLPWAMLTDSGKGERSFLARDLADPVAITVDAGPGQAADRHRGYKILQPPAPRLLLVMPEVVHPEAEKNTGAAAHRQALLALLQPHYEVCRAPDNIRTVRSYHEFRSTLCTDRFDPDIIYFYGHGTTTGFGAKFQFEAKGLDGGEEWMLVDEIQSDIGAVVRATRRPPFVWFNACLGAAAIQDSALSVFAETASCVVAMRTVVRMDASRKLAEAGLKSVIVDRFSPPVAIREVLRNCPADWMRSGHWASTVVAAQFSDWTALGAEQRVAEVNNAVGDFPMRVDRTDALADIEATLNRALADSTSSQAPTLLFWSGALEQGPVLFADRARDVMLERFPGLKPVFLTVELQPSVFPGGSADRDAQMLAAIFIGLGGRDRQRVSFDEIRGIILNTSPGRRGVFTMLHGPLRFSDAALIVSYIAIWTAICSDLADVPTAPRIVLAFGFVAERGGSPDLPEGSRIIQLGAVPPAEIKAHLARYRRLYNVSPMAIEDTSRELSEATHGIFRDLLARLDEMAEQSGAREAQRRD